MGCIAKPQKVILSCPKNPVKFACPQPGKPFSFSTQDQWLYDSVATEVTATAGTDVDIWTLDLAKSTIDPLYGEPSARKFNGPFNLKAQIEWPEATPEALETGLEVIWPGGLWVPRATLEASGVRPLREGDVVRFWNIPYFQQAGVHHLPNIPNAGYYFVIIKSVDDGHLYDTANFTAFRCDLKRTTKFSPERLILAQ